MLKEGEVTYISVEICFFFLKIIHNLIWRMTKELHLIQVSVRLKLTLTVIVMVFECVLILYLKLLFIVIYLLLLFINECHNNT